MLWRVVRRVPLGATYEFLGVPRLEASLVIAHKARLTSAQNGGVFRYRPAARGGVRWLSALKSLLRDATQLATDPCSSERRREHWHAQRIQGGATQPSGNT
jgi:hypothetical protein